jgi:Methylase of chemotaxis methyl-accepting proteins
MNPETFELFKEFIETNLGIKIPPSKKIMLESRLAKRLRALKIPTYEEYCAYVFSQEGFEREIQQLIDVVTTNETDFFREGNHYEILKDQILPELVIDRRVDELNVWSVAASTGQEAYTLAMVLEEFSRGRSPFRYRILGTDISETVLRVAQIGIYTEHQASKIPSPLKRKYCMQSKNPEQKTIRFKPEIRDRIMFRKMNLMDNEYQIKKKYQIVFCRNVFIYFDRPTQKKVLERIYSHMAPGGYLFMGHSENIGSVQLPLSNVASAVYKKTAQE